jgi:hypothetical protein
MFKTLGLIGAIIISVLIILLGIASVVALPMIGVKVYSYLVVYLGSWTIPVMVGGIIFFGLIVLGAIHIQKECGE